MIRFKHIPNVRKCRSLFVSRLLCLIFSYAALFSCRPIIDEPDPHNPITNDSITPRDTTQHGDTIPQDTVKNETPDQKRNPDYLYDLQAVPEITLTLTVADWNEYLHNFDQDKDNRKYVPAHFTMRKGDDIWTRDSVGLRPRGNTSRRRPEGKNGEQHRDGNTWRHAHFGVKFTEYDSGERFFGSDRIILKWFKEDPSYAREIYCYDLFRRFGVWTAPRASYCRLSIYIEGDSKPVYMGVYEMIEGIRKGYLADRRKDGYMPDNDGNLWKAGYGANLSDFNSNGIRRMGITDDTHSYVYSLKTNKTTGLSAAQTELYNFMEQMRPLPSGSVQLKTYLEEHMSVDLFLRALTVNVAVGMWDDYWINQNNYYFYFDSEHRFYFIPFDYDNTLGTSQNGLMNDSGTKDPMTWGSTGGDRLLCRKVLSIAEYKQRYKQYLLELAASDDYFGATGSGQRIQAWQSLVRQYVSNDTGEDMVIEDRPASWSSTQQYRLTSGSIGQNYFLTRKNTIDKYCK